MTRFNHWLCVVALAGAVMALIAAGCETENGRFHTDVLASDAQLVGGGLNINWTPPEPGTAYLLETTTGKVVETRTLAEGEPFTLEVRSIVEAKDLEAMLGIEIDKAEFLLYFRPLQRPRATGQETE